MSTAFRTFSFTDAASTTAKLNIGTVMEDEYGRKFMYTKQVGATTAAVGEWVCAATSGTLGEVSRTAATSCVNAVSSTGVAVGVNLVSTVLNSFSWTQIQGCGIVALAVTDGNVVQGDPLVVDGGGTPVGATDTMADGEEEGICGWALAADVGTTQAAGSYTIRSCYT